MNEQVQGKGEEARQWWDVPLFPAYRKQRQEDFEFEDSKFQDRHSYAEKLRKAK